MDSGSPLFIWERLKVSYYASLKWEEKVSRSKVELTKTKTKLRDALMIENFDDFCLWMYVLVDDLWKEIVDGYKHRRQMSLCSDSELMSMVLISECQGWDVETEALSHWQSHRDLFPFIPSQSRYNRRRRALSDVFKVMRQQILAQLDVAYDPQCALDSLPISVCTFHHAPRASSRWRAHDAQLGYVSAKKQWIYGYRLQNLVTLRGVIVDFMLAPAGYKDSEVVGEFLSAHSGRRILADKGYVNHDLAQQLAHDYGVYLIARTRKNQKRYALPAPLQHVIPRWRQICETVHSQLVEQFHIQRNYARSFDGLCTRLLAKLTAHTFCIYLNRLFGNADFLAIKSLAFPN